MFRAGGEGSKGGEWWERASSPEFSLLDGVKSLLSSLSWASWKVIWPFWASVLTTLFLKYKFIYFNWRLITLHYCIGFAIHQHESTTGIHVFPILIPPPSSLPVPSLWVISVHQPQASSIMFQCHSPKSSHLLPLPQSPKDCSIHLSLFCCLTYRVIVIIFLNSIYMRCCCCCC